MKTLPLLLIAGAGYFALNQNKKKSSGSTNATGDKGFKMSNDCKDIIVTDYEKAMKFAFNEGKTTKKAPTSITEQFFDKCDPKILNKTKENLTFHYNLTLSFLQGIFTKTQSVEKISALFTIANLVYFNLIDVFDENKLDYKNLPHPIDIPAISNKVLPICGYNFTNCTLNITNDNNFAIFVTALSRTIAIMFKTISLDESSELFDFLIGEILPSDKCKDSIDANEVQKYLLTYYYHKGQVEGNKIHVNDANLTIAERLSDLQKANIDTKGLPTKL